MTFLQAGQYAEGMAGPFEVVLTRTAFAHLKTQRRYDRNAILDAIKGQLTQSPAEETRNRKLPRENPLADWELRVGRFRVFYEVDARRRAVRVLAIGIKEGSKLIIGGKEVAL